MEWNGISEQKKIIKEALSNSDEMSEEDVFILERYQAIYEQAGKMSDKARSAYEEIEDLSKEYRDPKGGMFYYYEITVPAHIEKDDAKEAIELFKLMADPSSKFIENWETNKQPRRPNNKGGFKR